ncbi:probable aminotransferase TAT2 [Cynara cardunculus var. scolymus]|uniref:Aminotransferase, class I/classII n=1 Tax=Cynara cardunculus var. scolymus TaxID=59895 RepID=A0A124SD51_CYNCS|nr:probable aminotransferase TAT2 [Cynara cardunculus var. scolymus]KVH95842.1 Aminotransferase, class I/classII [Cynara cardunculus var. scolymus]
MGTKEWKFRENRNLRTAATFSIKRVLDDVNRNLDRSDGRPIIPLSHGDPSSFSCFRTTQVAEDAVVDALRSAKFNGYAPKGGALQARRSIAEYLSRNLPYKLSPDDVYVTLGAKQAIEVVLSALSRPGANILLPRPGYPVYEAHAVLNHLEVRHFDLLQEKDWEVDLNGLETLVDDKTVAMVIINPGNPCGNVFTRDHLQKIAETARRMGILVIADEAYAHLTFGSNSYVSMGVFGNLAPVLTLGTLSKRWLVPGWRLGWIARSDPDGIFEEHGVVECIKRSLITNTEAATFIQAAVPQILENTTDDFFVQTINILQEDADMCYKWLKDIPCFTCLQKPQGSLFLMVKLDFSQLQGINDDMDFCSKLAKEESVLLLPGFVLGLKNWIRVTFAIEPSALEEGLARIKAFCMRHANKQ